MTKKKTPLGICTDCGTRAVVWECGFDDKGRRSLCAFCLRQLILRDRAKRLTT